ncbi:MAG: hypothetical protein GY757_28080, partial [bacterium]|nr:hypothetical protein [bacterium]
MAQKEQPQMSDEFWDNYYSRLEKRLDAGDAELKPEQCAQPIHLHRKFNLKSHWAIYPAAAAALLVIGIAIGQLFFHPEAQKLFDETVSSIRQLNPAVEQHFGNVQPLLVDYSNYTPPADNDTDDNIMVEKSTVEQLLKENRLLKQLVARQNNMPVKKVMEDLELILLELANSNGNAAEVRTAVQKYIN